MKAEHGVIIVDSHSFYNWTFDYSSAQSEHSVSRSSCISDVSVNASTDAVLYSCMEVTLACSLSALLCTFTRITDGSTQFSCALILPLFFPLLVNLFSVFFFDAKSLWISSGNMSLSVDAVCKWGSMSRTLEKVTHCPAGRSWWLFFVVMRFTDNHKNIKTHCYQCSDPWMLRGHRSPLRNHWQRLCQVLCFSLLLSIALCVRLPLCWFVCIPEH